MTEPAISVKEIGWAIEKLKQWSALPPTWELKRVAEAILPLIESPEYRALIEAATDFPKGSGAKERLTIAALNFGRRGRALTPSSSDLGEGT